MPNTLRFWKVQSIANDFVLVHQEDVDVLTKETESFLPRLANLICERRFGVGSDGLLVLSRNGDRNLKLRMFNPDGTEDFCGNGLRCAAVHAEMVGWAAGKFTISHRDRVVETELLGEGKVRTVIGKADYTPEKVPVKAGKEIFKQSIFLGMIDGQPLSIYGSAITTGSTHVVIPTTSLPDDESFQSISSRVEKHEMFPEHTSVIWTKEDAPGFLSIRIWERGVGETQGCGTGSSAAAADYMRRRFRGGPIVVKNPGGIVTVFADSWDAPLTVEGTAFNVYSGTYSADALL
jgi:diaminopimelate epimerase